MKKQVDKTYIPSHYQQAIFDFVEHGQGNAVVEAVPGAGKSYTLLQCLKHIPEDSKVLVVAFNTDIVKELQAKIKKLKCNLKIDCRTMHSLGYSILGSNYRDSKLEVQDYKYNNWIKEYLSTNKDEKYESLSKKDKNQYISNVKTFIDFGRYFLCQTVKDLNYVESHYSISTLGDEKSIAIKALKWGKNELSAIDFTDMVWLPITLHCKPYKHLYDWILMDECFPARQNIAIEGGKMTFGRLAILAKKNLPLPKAKSYNVQTKEFEYKQITKVWNRGEKKLIKISLGTKKKIHCTPNERFLTPNGYVYASELKIGDYLCASYKEQPYHKFLNEEQKEIFQALAIGDGHDERLSLGIHRMKLIHGEPQKEYLFWKSRIFNSESKIRYIEKQGYSHKPAYASQLVGYCIKDEEMDKLYIINNLTIKQLAINYCDNGSLSNNCSSLYTCVNNLEYVQALQKRLGELGIKNTTICKSKSSTSHRDYWYIYFSADATRKMHSLIAKYVHPNLAYKILDKYKDEVGTYVWNSQEEPLGGMTITNIEEDKPQVVYDIEVEDNHNFVIVGEGNGKVGNDGIIVHNCQDLEKEEQVLINICKKMSTRFLAFGEKNQSIYSFKGASSTSFEDLKNEPHTISLPLSITYRCSKRVVNFLKKYNTAVQAAYDAKEGEVKFKCSIDEIQDGDMVLCRNNAPLMELYSMLSKQGVTSYIRGKDIGDNLINLVKATKEKELNITLRKKGVFSVLYNQLFDMLDVVMKTHGITMDMAMDDMNVNQMYDKILALKALSVDIEKTSDLIEKLEGLFSDNEKVGISLSTIHKAKGLEAENVYICCPSLLPSKSAKLPWEIEEERNLEYVAYSRPKNKLGFLDESAMTQYNSSSVQKVNDLNDIKQRVFWLYGNESRCSGITPTSEAAQHIIENATKIEKKAKNLKSMSTTQSVTYGSMSMFKNKKKTKIKL